MIARAEPVRSRTTVTAWKMFLAMLPAITRHARVAFRNRRGDERDDLIQEVVANAAVAFMRLVQLGKADLAYPSVLARYGVAQVLEGRRVGNRLLCSRRTVSERRASSSRGWTSVMTMMVRGSKQP